MANFYGHARSNYFKVKDVQAFEQALETVGIVINLKGDTVMVHPSYDNDVGWHSEYYRATRQWRVCF